MTIRSDSPVGAIAVEHPLSTRVFHRHGIDFCCDGSKSLSEACSSLGLPTEEIMSEIQAELEGRSKSEGRWDGQPIPDLIDHILATYHTPLWKDLPRLVDMADTVAEVHRDKDPERLNELRGLVTDLARELEQHMQREERVLFPLFRTGRGMEAGGPIAVMEAEHEAAGAALRRIRELTGDYTLPPGACTTWNALWHGLEALEVSLHEHIHLENNVLFPRALEGS